MNFNEKTVSRYLMKPEVYRCRFIWFLVITLVPLIFLGLLNSPPAAAQSVDEYFQLSYGSANLSQSEINGDGVFYATISGNVTCIKDLPVSEASITSRVVAENTVNGTVVELNPTYTVTIKHFPSKAGDVVDIKQTVPLRFPALAESGTYNVVAEIIEAKVKVAFVWVPVTDFLPKTQPFGSVKYVSSGISPAPSLPSVVTPSTPVPEPAKSASQPEPTSPTGSASSPEPAPSLALVESVIPWWMWLIVAIALATTIVNIALILRYRAARRTK